MSHLLKWLVVITLGSVPFLGISGNGMLAKKGKTIDSSNELVTLRNGTKAKRSRVKEIWKASEQIDDTGFHGERFYLWRACLAAKKARAENKVGDKGYDIRPEMKMLQSPEIPDYYERSLTKLERLGITVDHHTDEETENIILSIYCSSIEGYFAEKRYPIKSWYESIPGYSWYRVGRLLIAG